jgi:hypothetical protein
MFTPILFQDESGAIRANPGIPIQSFPDPMKAGKRAAKSEIPVLEMVI